VAVEGLSIRLYFDHHIRGRFAVDLRRQGFEVVQAREVGNELVADEVHLRWATDHRRVIFTHDLKDFPPLAEKWFLEGRDHAGIILSVQPGRSAPYNVLLRRLLRLLETLTADEMVNRVEWLDQRWSDEEAGVD
jgi:predicted nuclease of predicted toxin-antitoxin system